MESTGIERCDAGFIISYKTRAAGDSKTLGKIGDAVREGFYAVNHLVI